MESLFIPGPNSADSAMRFASLNANGGVDYTTVSRGSGRENVNNVPEETGTSFIPGVVCKCGSPGVDNRCLSDSRGNSVPFATQEDIDTGHWKKLFSTPYEPIPPLSQTEAAMVLKSGPV